MISRPKKVSIIIPVYNEEKFVKTLIQQIQNLKIDKKYFSLEILVVNDGSTDNTEEILSKIPNIKVLKQINLGKGRAVQNGIKNSNADLILIQDGDLEYDPNDYLKMLEPFKYEKKISVYGSRVMGVKEKYNFFFFKGKHPKQGFGPYFMNKILQVLFRILYKNNITDLLTGYKIYEKKFFEDNIIETDGFETDHEISAKLVKQSYKIIEVPINYVPRLKSEGKKINFIDGIKAIIAIIKYYR
tara:strand:- start:144 stop:872 length:729 start_codon:yes stop_codon:yes gene_type:complete